MELGFSDWHSGSEGILSTWRNKRQPVENSAQTEPLHYIDNETQVVITKTAEAQTSTSFLRDGEPYEEIKPPYPPSLYAFFAKVTGPMCEALEENLNPLYNLSIKLASDNGGDEDGSDDSDKTSATELYHLRSLSVTEDNRCSCVAWNCNGAQVAVGYQSCGSENKDGGATIGWCNHSSVIAVWSLGRLQNQKISMPMEPHKELELSGCVTACEFHPSNPSLLVAGLATGEIVLVDLYGYDAKELAEMKKKGDVYEGSSIMTSLDNGIFHSIYSSLHASSVESVRWTSQISSTGSILGAGSQNPSPSPNLLLTCAKDGQIGVWSLNKTGTKLFLEKRFIILPRNLPDSIEYKPHLDISVKQLGITCLASNHLEPTSFIVSTFGCFLFECVMDAEDELDPTIDLDMLQKSVMEVVPLVNGRPSFLNQLNSYVKAIDLSPFHQNLFLAVTIHGHASLQHTLRPGSFVDEFYMDEDTATDIKWSGQPMQFGVAWNKTLSLFNISKNLNEPILNIQHKEALSAIAFNKTQTDLVATIDVKGSMHIYKLPDSLKATPESMQKEMDSLIKLGQI